MFETAELGRTISKQAYAQAVPELRAQLLEAQELLRKKATFPLIILLAGVDKGGKSEVLNLLNEWFDPRYLENNAFGTATDEERERPYFWRYWRKLPARGKIGIFCGSSWYSEPFVEHVYGNRSESNLTAELVRIQHFEEAQVTNGALIIKIWFHLNKQAQKERIRTLEASDESAWRVSKKDKKHLKLYDKFRDTAEKVIRATSTGDAPWVIVEGKDENYRNLTCARLILEQLHKRLAQPEAEEIETPQTVAEPAPLSTILTNLDMLKSLDKSHYQKKLSKYQRKLNLLWRLAYRQQKATVIMLEGWDAAGKGGIIRRITPAVDARHYRVIPVAAPTEEERQFHYLWRFWRQLPRVGHISIFDRSWYGRVLVERVERFAKETEWRRAYNEINDFEEQLIHHGIILVKFWVHISQDEQLQRFKEREKIPYKQYKITEEDYRNREQWDHYELAMNEIVERTSTTIAPWNLIEGNDKRYARIKALRVLCRQLSANLD